MPNAKYNLKKNGLVTKPDYLIIGGKSANLDENYENDTTTFKGTVYNITIYENLVSISFEAESKSGGVIELEIEIDGKKLKTHPIIREEKKGVLRVARFYQIK